MSFRGGSGIARLQAGKERPVSGEGNFQLRLPRDGAHAADDRPLEGLGRAFLRFGTGGGVVRDGHFRSCFIRLGVGAYIDATGAISWLSRKIKTLHILREIRAALQGGLDRKTTSGFEAVDARFGKVEAHLGNIWQALNGESILGRYAVADVEQRLESLESDSPISKKPTRPT